MRNLRTCFVLFFIAVSEAVPVTIYYEALCYDSVRFITKQLYPNYEHFKDHLTIDFIPYGKASHSLNAAGKYTFSCQHGKDECKGNKFQACGLAQTDDQDTKVNFVTCVMSSRNPSDIYYIEACANKHRLDFANITACVVSREGDKLLAANGDKTWKLEPNLYYVPTVVYNNSVQIDDRDQAKSLRNFKAIMCSKINNDAKPEICSDLGFLERMRHFFS